MFASYYDIGYAEYIGNSVLWKLVRKETKTDI